MTISSEAAIDMVASRVGISDHDMLDSSRQNVVVVWGTCGKLIRRRGCVWRIWERWIEKGGGA